MVPMAAIYIDCRGKPVLKQVLWLQFSTLTIVALAPSVGTLSNTYVRQTATYRRPLIYHTED